jgi:hypothetical protein
MSVDFPTLHSLRRLHPAWRLLAADNAPFIAAFLHHAFIAPNVRALPEPELVAGLDDYLHHVRAILDDETAFPKSARDYLADWSSDERPWLRTYYPEGRDVAHYDLMPATERAIEWLAGLEQRPFVGTESRLLTVFELLQQMVHGSETDPQARIDQLEGRKAAIDAEIQRIREGRLELMDPTQLRERFLQMASTARALLADFREVEHNFRDLDRQVRERIATWEGSKGELLGEILGERDAISDSDQGRSFRAFWDFLMSPSRQEELSTLLEQVWGLEAVAQLGADPRLLRIHYDWLEAGEVAQRTVARLSEQLRRYLDDQAWLENRRIMGLIREIELHALALRETPPDAVPFLIDEPTPSIDLTMERPLFSPPLVAQIDSDAVAQGDAPIAVDALFDQAYVDREQLRERIRRALQTRNQVSLAAVVEAHPLEHGLAELVTYLAIAADDPQAVIDDEQRVEVAWQDLAGHWRQATLPAVIFARR